MFIKLIIPHLHQVSWLVHNWVCVHFYSHIIILEFIKLAMCNILVTFKIFQKVLTFYRYGILKYWTSSFNSLNKWKHCQVRIFRSLRKWTLGNIFKLLSRQPQDFQFTTKLAMGLSYHKIFADANLILMTWNILKIKDMAVELPYHILWKSLHRFKVSWRGNTAWRKKLSRKYDYYTTLDGLLKGGGR